MKKVIIITLLLAVLAGAACADVTMIAMQRMQNGEVIVWSAPNHVALYLIISDENGSRLQKAYDLNPADYPLKRAVNPK
jgi:hypothetical protein